MKPSTHTSKEVFNGNWVQEMEDRARLYPKLLEEKNRLLDSNRELLEALNHVLFSDIMFNQLGYVTQKKLTDAYVNAKNLQS